MNDQKIDAETKGLKRRPPAPAPDDKPQVTAPAEPVEEKEDEEPVKAAPTRRKLDPELKAMDEVCEILESLDKPMQRRVLMWALQKFNIPPNGAMVFAPQPGDAELFSRQLGGQMEVFPR